MTLYTFILLACLTVASWTLPDDSIGLPQIGFRETLERLDPIDAQHLRPDGPHFIDMPIDHFNASTTSTFKNRFWINSTYFKTGGPVFLFDSGEQDAEPLLPYYLQEYHGLSATMRLAKRYHGLAILWEHRFYGQSLPFPVNQNTTSDQWKFLTTEQALEDVIFFANSFGSASANSSALSLPVHPSSTPWIWLGGSYPGIRGAMLRLRNPETIFAAWASSAPVHAQVDMSSYYMAAERSLTRNCSADWVAVTKYVDGILTGDNETLKDALKVDLMNARLSGPGHFVSGSNTSSAQISDLGAAGVLMDPLRFYQYYGFNATLLPFCNLLETQNFTSAAHEGGLVSVLGIESAFRAFLVAIAELDYDSVPRGRDDPVTDRSWMWQYCSEYGFYQRGDSTNPLSIETSLRSLALFQQQCNSAFPKGLPPSPQVQNVNKYGGWNMNPPNTLFTNGEFDPWRTQGLASIEANSPHRTASVVVPRCNQSPPNNSFFGLTYANMVHVTDMRVLLTPDANHTNFQTVGFYSPVSQEPFYAGLALFQLALDEWLPCFTSGAYLMIIALFASCWLASVPLGRAQDDGGSNSSMIYDFNNISPSTDVSWTPCFDSFDCARFQVPLDYDDPNQGTTDLAFIRIAASTQPAPSILMNPGGPGGSGVGEILGAAPILRALLGDSYNIVYIDPRGVNNTTPNIDCFPGSPQTRDTFRTLYFREVANATSTSYATQFAYAQAYGEWCNASAGGPNGTARFAGTAAVARDMLTFIEAEARSLGQPESEAQLWYYAYSYGTVLGATFAAMYPNRIGRMVLDSVMDTEDYYLLQWRRNLFDADAVMERFFTDCSAAGEDGCAFWGPNATDVRSRFDSILASLKEQPLPVSVPLGAMPMIATYADLKQLLRRYVYFPLAYYPTLAGIMHDLENGNGTSLLINAGVYFGPLPERAAWAAGDAGSIIPCVDGWGRSNLTVEGWQEQAEFLINQSRYIGDAWGHIPLDCISMDVPPPASGRYNGYLPTSAANTSFPIMFVNNDLDPVTPLRKFVHPLVICVAFADQPRSARRMSSVFGDSVVVSQNGIGHVTFLSNPSNCTTQLVQAYLNGTVPAANSTCEVDTQTSIPRGAGNATQNSS
ncbi:hypothetical protein ONZ45_g10275 [Pleurotus djamor]|nr:hypothetical protein ONZ45_g10275 [Pleurotus djamor]